MLRVLLAFSALLGATLLVGVFPASGADTPTVTILVGDYYFCEPQYQGGVCKTYIDPGDTVLWDFSPTGPFELHTATHCGDNCVFVTDTPLFDSGVLTQSGSYKFTFDTPGQYLYYCALHPVTMLGEINVGVEPTPTPAGTVTATAIQEATPATPTPFATPTPAPGTDTPPPDDGTPPMATPISEMSPVPSPPLELPDTGTSLPREGQAPVWISLIGLGAALVLLSSGWYAARRTFR